MRRLLLSLLLLSSAAPALAMQSADDPLTPEAREGSRVERPEPPRRTERPQRPERDEPRFNRPERAEPRTEQAQAVEPPPPPPPSPEVERPRPPQRSERPSDVERPDRREGRERRERWGTPAGSPGSPDVDTRSTDSVSGWRWRERDADRRRRQGDVPPTPPSPVYGESGPGPKIVTPPVDSRSDSRSGDRLRDRVAAEGWRREWRQDRRYDWRRHRDRDRSRFRVGIYIDPFGWNYRRWQIGWNLYPRFYSHRYWIDEPWQYRLPPVYGPYRWIRYYDDVLLVDLRTGRVVDVIYNFFW